MASSVMRMMSVDVPSSAMPGKIFDVTVTLQVLMPGIYAVYADCEDRDNWSHPFDLAVKSMPGEAGMIVDLVLKMKKGFLMPPYPWRLRFYIGVAGITLYPPEENYFHNIEVLDAPDCPEGYVYDPNQDLCVPKGGSEIPSWVLYAGAGGVGLLILGYLMKPPRRKSKTPSLASYLV